MVDIVHWNYLWLHIVWHCDIVWHWKYLCLHVVSTHCVYTLENIYLPLNVVIAKSAQGKKYLCSAIENICNNLWLWDRSKSPKIFVTVLTLFTGNNCDKPYGEHFLVTLSPFRNVIISSSSESSTMDWDADELNKSSSNKHRVMLMMWSHSFHWKCLKTASKWQSI